MKSGCAGCTAMVILPAAFLAGTLGAAWMAVMALQEPEVEIPVLTAADSARAQRKIFDVARGSREVILSERELNALLRRNLAGLPVASPAARLLEDETVELTGRVPLRRAVADYPFRVFLNLFPTRALERSVWLGVRARVAVDAWPRRSLYLDVAEFRLGRQRLPVVLFRLMVDPAVLAALRWPLPETIESVRVEPGRLIIRSAASR